MPMNYLLIEALERYHHYWGDDLQLEFPTGSGNLMNLKQIAHEIARRLTNLFLPDENGRRPCFGDDPRYATIRIGRTSSSSTSTSAESRGVDSARRIRPAGRR